MTAYKFMAIVDTLTKSDIAGIITGCGYALRENISLFSALKEMGFDIEMDGVPNISDEKELSYVGISCFTQILKRHPSNLVDVSANQPRHTPTPLSQIKIQDLLSQLDFIDIASVIHTATEALRHSCGFARCYADLGVNIALFHSGEEDSDWMREDIADIRDTRGLVNLIAMASVRLQSLSK